MIHYTCDCCKRTLDSQHELRYVVRMEVYASLDDDEESANMDDDHLQAIQDMLEDLDDKGEPEFDGEFYEQLRFDLCCDCRKRFLKNPMGRQVAAQFNFSKN